EGAGRETEGIVSLRAGRERAGGEKRSHESLIEAQCAESGRLGRPCGAHRHDHVIRIDVHRPVPPLKIVHPADAADVAKALPGRRDLKRPNQYEQSRDEPFAPTILESIAHAGYAAPRPLR